MKCLEFCVSNSKSASDLLKALDEINLKAQVQIHDVEDSVKLAYENSEVREGALEDFKTIVELASDYNVELITLHPAYYRPEFDNYIPSPHANRSLDYFKGYEVMVNSLREVSRHADKHGITLGLENMECFSLIEGKLLITAHYGCEKSELLKIIHDVGSSNLKVTYDVGHANLTEEGPVEFCKDIVDLIVDVHVSDNDGSRDEHGPIGHGNIDFNEVFEVLARNGYEGPTIIEQPYDNYLLNDIKVINDMLKKLSVVL